MGEWNQGVWVTCLIQGPSVLPKKILETIHPSALEKNLQGRKSLEIVQLLKDFFMKSRLQGKTRLVQKPLW